MFSFCQSNHLSHAFSRRRNTSFSHGLHFRNFYASPTFDARRMVNHQGFDLRTRNFKTTFAEGTWHCNSVNMRYALGTQSQIKEICTTSVSIINMKKTMRTLFWFFLHTQRTYNRGKWNEDFLKFIATLKNTEWKERQGGLERLEKRWKELLCEYIYKVLAHTWGIDASQSNHKCKYELHFHRFSQFQIKYVLGRQSDTYIGLEFAVQLYTLLYQCMHKPDNDFSFYSLGLISCLYFSHTFLGSIVCLKPKL